MKDIYHVPPADNEKLATMELAVEIAWKKNPEPTMNTMLMEIQSLIERVKLDDKKIRQLEKMKGIKWQDEGKCLVTGCDRKAVWDSPLGGLCAKHWRGKGEKGGKGVTAANLYKDRSVWDIPIAFADGGIRAQAFWAGRECGAKEMEKHG